MVEQKSFVRTNFRTQSAAPLLAVAVQGRHLLLEVDTGHVGHPVPTKHKDRITERENNRKTFDVVIRTLFSME